MTKRSWGRRGRRGRRGWAWLAVGLALLLGAGEAAALDACGLVAQPEAAAALGQAVKPGKPSGPNPIGQTICFFEAEKADQVRFVQVSLLPLGKKGGPRRSSAAGMFKQMVAMIDGPQPVPGLGDEAVWGGSGLRMGAGLHVRQGDYYLNLTVATGQDARNLAAAKELAAKALTRLK